MPKIKCLAVSLIGLAVATTWRLSFAPAMKIFGAITNAATADQMRDFYLGGRVVLFPVPFPSEPLGFPLNLIMGVIQRLPHWYILLPVLVFGLLFWLYHHFLKAKLGSLPLPRMIWRTLIVSCICYALAWPLLFYLYVPERYLEYTFLLVPVFMLGGLPYLLQKRYPAQQGRIAAGFIALTILATSFAWRSDLMKIPSRERLLYSYLKTLPEDAMIAATPALASNIPLYAFRSVLLSNEAYIPFHQGYFKEMKARLRDWLQAYYATDAAPVAALIAQYDIDYIIIQAKDFKPDRLQELPRRHYYAFENSFFTALIQPDVNAYWLLNRPQACTLYDTNALRVLDAHCLLRS